MAELDSSSMHSEEVDYILKQSDKVEFSSNLTSNKMADTQSTRDDFSQAATATSSGYFSKDKRTTLLLCILSMVLLLCLCAGFLFMEVRTHLAGKRLQANVKFGVQVSDVIHNLQQERDMTAFFLSSHTRKTKSHLAKLYKNTDLSLVALERWPTEDPQEEDFMSKTRFQRILVEHRAAINATDVAYRSEMTYYSGLISEMMNWLVKLINIPEAGTVYRDLVALQAMEAKDAFGLERAYGVVCLTIGGFLSQSDYQDFSDSQATAYVIFDSAVEYSDLLREKYHIYVTNEENLITIIRKMRKEIVRMDVIEDGEQLPQLQPSAERALWWFDNMTIYVDSVFLMTLDVRQTIIERMNISDNYDTMRLTAISVVLLSVLMLCGVTGREVNELLQEYAQSGIMLTNRVTEKKRLDDFVNELRFGHLPSETHQQLSHQEVVPPTIHHHATVMTAHITGLPAVDDTTASEIASITREVLSIFNELVVRFDMFTPEPDTYPPFVISGLGVTEPHDDAQNMARFALELLEEVNKIRPDVNGAAQISVRVGIHTGPIVAGLVNTGEIPSYVFPGDSLPILTKLVNCSEDGRIHLSYPTYQILHDLGGFVVRKRKTKIDNIQVSWTPTAWLLGVVGAALSDDQDRDSVVGECSLHALFKEPLQDHSR